MCDARMQLCHPQAQADDPPKIQARSCETQRLYSSHTRPNWCQNSPSFLSMAQSVPLLLRHQRHSHVHWHRWTPLIRRQASGRKLTNHSLQPHSHHLGKTHLTLPRNPLGLPKKVVGNLYLCFYHDGNLPATSGWLIFYVQNSCEEWVNCIDLPVILAMVEVFREKLKKSDETRDRPLFRYDPFPGYSSLTIISRNS